MLDEEGALKKQLAAAMMGGGRGEGGEGGGGEGMEVRAE